MTTTVDPRLAIVSRLNTPPYDGAAGTYSTPLDEAAQLLDAYQAAVWREAADDLATAFGDPMAKHIGILGASHLRRRAREIEAGQTGEDQPETPLEKRLRYSERRNDELRAECKRRGKRVLEQSEKIITLEREIDEVRRQLGAEILRAGQAEAELRRLADEDPITAHGLREDLFTGPQWETRDPEAEERERDIQREA